MSPSGAFSPESGQIFFFDTSLEGLNYTVSDGMPVPLG
jgi:hypothetical protein